jgi:hypothetical protein
LGAFAAAVDAFDGDEFAGRGEHVEDSLTRVARGRNVSGGDRVVLWEAARAERYNEVMT